SLPFEQQDSLAVATFSPDGRRVLVCAGDQAAQLVRPDGTERLRLPHRSPVRAGVFSPDGKQVLTGCWDGSVQLWDAGNGSNLGPPLLHDDPVNALAFHPE